MKCHRSNQAYLEVRVSGNNTGDMDKALNQLKKKMGKEGIFILLKEKRGAESRGEKRRRKKAKCIRRLQRVAAKQKGRD